MEAGQEFQCEIEKCVFGSDGLTRIDGEVVFIPGTLPGEKLIAKITAPKKNFSRAEVVRFGVTSPHRQEPVCRYFGRCPGCQYLHTDYAYETELKLAQLKDLLASSGIEPETMLDPVAPQPPENYRNKVVLHVHTIGSAVKFGYVMQDNQTVCDIDHCFLAHPAINEELKRLRSDRSYMASLREGMDVTIRNTAKGVQSWRNAPAKNATWLREQLSFGELSVPCGSFFQVNKEGAEALLSAVGRIIDRLEPNRFIDLYGGVGFFGSYAASKGVKDVLVVESDAAAAEAAKFNLKKFGISEPQVIAGDAGLALKELKSSEAPDTLLLVDPPRGGLTLRAAMCITGSALENFIYISCNPATWARDAVRLQKGGFKLKELQLVNMFPRTEHFELVSFFCR